ncbi:MAG: class I SAM-dependent rRNA methyltransferase [Parachlamydiaceae bacterium]
MSEIKNIILKPGKEKAILNRHHWIFSGAISQWPKHRDGQVLGVMSADGRFLGYGYFNKKAAISGRMLTFDRTLPQVAILQHLQGAAHLRTLFFSEQTTNAFRIVNGEGDLIPGLVIDRYNDIFVIQVTTLGIQNFIPIIVDWLVKTYHPKTIVEKSITSTRKEEGLAPVQRTLYGKDIREVITLENNLKMVVQPIEGQKTGFFLDHRDMRLWVRELAHGKRVLNCFSYSGGFSINALYGGASHVTSVDISKQAIDLAKRNVELNRLDSKKCSFQADDVFLFLRQDPIDYELVILDPPAFAKKAKDVIPACRGYKDINRLAIQKMPPSSLLLSCSCSYYVNTELFQKVLFQAAVEANRKVKIIGQHRQAIDHPLNLCHKESDYLKSFLLFIE